MAIEGENERATAPGNAWRSEPASSILASRFVPHLATQGNESHLTRETFAQLRQELLSEIQSQLRVDEDVTDINKLICIVLKAGLELNPNRSASEQDLEAQVLDCLDIIQASIEKAPQALWESSDPLILGEDIHAPLFAWLILRLIRLATTWSSETVQEKIQLLCASLAYSQFKQARSLPASYAVAAFLRACTSDILCSLETFQRSNSWDTRPGGLSIPAANGSLIEDTQNLGLSPGLFNSNTALGSFVQTASLACRLLDSFNPRGEMQSRAKHHDLILRQNFSWVLNGFHRLRQVIVEWLQVKGAQLTSEDAIVPLQYLTYLHRCCVPESTLAGLLSNMSLTSTWSQCLCGFLSLENIGSLPSVQVILSRYLCDLAETAKSSQPLMQQLRETLLPVLTEVKDGNSSLQSPESCLWVSLLSYLT